jgi:hypothetical protein
MNNCVLLPSARSPTEGSSFCTSRRSVTLAAISSLAGISMTSVAVFCRFLDCFSAVEDRTYTAFNARMGCGSGSPRA